MIFFGAISEVKTVWSLVDIVLAGIAIPHMTALILHAYRNPHSIPLALDLNLNPDQKEERIIPEIVTTQNSG